MVVLTCIVNGARIFVPLGRYVLPKTSSGLLVKLEHSGGAIQFRVSTDVLVNGRLLLKDCVCCVRVDKILSNRRIFIEPVITSDACERAEHQYLLHPGHDKRLKFVELDGSYIPRTSSEHDENMHNKYPKDSNAKGDSEDLDSRLTRSNFVVLFCEDWRFFPHPGDVVDIESLRFCLVANMGARMVDSVEACTHVLAQKLRITEPIFRAILRNW